MINPYLGNKNCSFSMVYPVYPHFLRCKTVSDQMASAQDFSSLGGFYGRNWGKGTPNWNSPNVVPTVDGRNPAPPGMVKSL